MKWTPKSWNLIGTQIHQMPGSRVAGWPPGTASPTGRVPHERSRVAVHREGSTPIVRPSTRSSPRHVPTCANRHPSRITLLDGPPYLTCCGSLSGPYSDSNQRSNPTPWSSPSHDRCSRRNGSTTSIRYGPTSWRSLSAGRTPDAWMLHCRSPRRTDRERIDDAEVGIDAESGEEVCLGLVVQALVDAAVVGVAVGRADSSRHGHGQLMDRVLVERVKIHGGSIGRRRGL